MAKRKGRIITREILFGNQGLFKIQFIRGPETWDTDTEVKFPDSFCISGDNTDEFIEDLEKLINKHFI